LNGVCGAAGTITALQNQHITAFTHALTHITNRIMLDEIFPTPIFIRLFHTILSQQHELSTYKEKKPIPPWQPEHFDR
jgi:hypothetical protein